MAGGGGRDSEDMMSDLPDVILTAILCGLPLKEAVRTSVLSRRWRHLWISIPHLQLNETLVFIRFDENIPRLKDCFLQLQIDGSLRSNSIINGDGCHGIYSRVETRSRRWLSIVYNVLLLRKDPIKSCLISFPRLQSYSSHIDVLLFFLSRIGVEKLFLFNNHQQHPYYVPSHLFFFKSLVSSNSMPKGSRVVEIPRHFRGSMHLNTLLFFHVVSNNHKFENVISFCPALEWDVLYRRFGMTLGSFRQNYAILKEHYNFTTRPMHSLLKDASRLEEARFSFISFYGFGDDFEEDDVGVDGKFASFLGRSSTTQLQRLYIAVCRGRAKNHDMDALLLNADLLACDWWQKERGNVRNLGKRMCKNFLHCLPEHFQFHNLKALLVDLEFIDEQVLPFISFLLRRCPRLHQLFVEFTGELKPLGAYALHDYWDKEGPFECVKNSLETVQMGSVDLDCEYEIGFASYLLLNATVLKTMNITCNESKDKVPSACSTDKKPSFSHPRGCKFDSPYPSKEERRERKSRVLKELLHLQKASSDAQLTIKFGMT